MVPLGACGADLGSLDTAILLESAMVLLNSPREGGIGLPRALAELLIAAGPVLRIRRVSVRGDDPKDAHEAVAAKMHPSPVFTDLALGDGPVSRSVRVDLAI